MTSKHAIEWLDTIINIPQVCGGNLEDNNKALNKIKKDLEELEQIKNVLRIYGLADLKDTCDLLDTRLEEDLKCFTNLLKYGKKTIEQVEKGLEVLEILRPHLINAGIGKFDNVEDNEVFHLKVNLWGKEYNKLEEWLKNEN